MRCSNCDNLCSLDDNFCRKCGASLRNVRVPAARNGSQLPVAWRGAMPVVVQGVALLALTAVSQMLVRELARHPVADFVSQPADLEEIFLELFREGSDGR